MAAVKGFKLSEKRDALLDEYYEIHNWDAKTGLPTGKCLEELNLRQAADDIGKAGN